MDAHWLARDRDGDDDLRLPPALCVTHGNVCFAHHCAHDEGPTPTRPAPGCQHCIECNGLPLWMREAEANSNGDRDRPFTPPAHLATWPGGFEEPAPYFAQRRAQLRAAAAAAATRAAAAAAATRAAAADNDTDGEEGLEAHDSLVAREVPVVPKLGVLAAPELSLRPRANAARPALWARRNSARLEPKTPQRRLRRALARAFGSAPATTTAHPLPALVIPSTYTNIKEGTPDAHRVCSDVVASLRTASSSGSGPLDQIDDARMKPMATPQKRTRSGKATGAR